MIEPCDPRMYLILREDLAFKYVQGAHALAQCAIKYPTIFTKWNNEYLICLSVFNGLALHELDTKLDTELNTILYSHSVFYEPDLKSELPTAICIFEDGTGYVSHALRDLKLATK